MRLLFKKTGSNNIHDALYDVGYTNSITCNFSSVNTDDNINKPYILDVDTHTYIYVMIHDFNMITM